MWGALCFVVWWGLLWLILGTPNSELSLIWLLPPALLAVYGWRDGRTNRRRKVTEWALTARWMSRGHRPVIALARHPATRADSARLLERIGHRFGRDDPLAVVLPWRAVPGRAQGPRALSARGGAGVGGRPMRAQLVGTDLAQQRRDAVLRRTTRRRPSRATRPAA